MYFMKKACNVFDFKNFINMKFLLLSFTTAFLWSCSTKPQIKTKETIPIKKTIVFSVKSELPNEYKNFDSPKAINKVVTIENNHFNKYADSLSNYYGTEWRNKAETINYLNDSLNDFEVYWNEMKSKGIHPDSMHCTIYAVEALQAGMDSLFDSLEVHHKSIWKTREHAGWSIGHILVKEFGWKAYLFISKDSQEYKRCKNNFIKDSLYWVWKQPDIPLSGLFEFDTEKGKINSLLSQHEFGWGFSDQGYHTWITRFDTLKECIWIGAPSDKYDRSGAELFEKPPK